MKWRMSRAVQTLHGSGGPTPTSPQSRAFISLTQNSVQSEGEIEGDFLAFTWFQAIPCILCFRPRTVKRRPEQVRRLSKMPGTGETPQHPLNNPRRGPNTHLRCEAGCLRGQAREVVQPPVARRSSDTPTPTPQCPKTPHKKRYAGSLASSPVRRL